MKHPLALRLPRSRIWWAPGAALWLAMAAGCREPDTIGFDGEAEDPPGMLYPSTYDPVRGVWIIDDTVDLDFKSVIATGVSTIPFGPNLKQPEDMEEQKADSTATKLR